MIFWSFLLIYGILVFVAFRRFYSLLRNRKGNFLTITFFSFVCGYLTFLFYYFSAYFPGPNPSIYREYFVAILPRLYTYPWWLIVLAIPKFLNDTPLIGIFYLSDIVTFTVTFWFYYFLVFSLWTLIYKIRKRMESKATLE